MDGQDRRFCERFPCPADGRASTCARRTHDSAGLHLARADRAHHTARSTIAPTSTRSERRSITCSRAILRSSSRTRSRLVHAHIALTPRPLSELDARIPEHVEKLVDKLLAKSPDDRYRSARGIVADIERCQERLRSGNSHAFPLGGDDLPETLAIPDRLYGRVQRASGAPRCRFTPRPEAAKCCCWSAAIPASESARWSTMQASSSSGAGVRSSRASSTSCTAMPPIRRSRRP